MIASELEPASQSMNSTKNRRITVNILQILVGGLVTGGGLAFATFAVNSFGSMLGIIHFSIGVVVLISGIVMVSKRNLSRNLLLFLNGLVIVYSSFSESLVEIQALLPTSAAMDSLIGTVIAIIMSFVIIVLIGNETPIKEKDL